MILRNLIGIDFGAKWKLFLFIGLLPLFSLGQSDGSKIAGVWLNGEKTGKVEINKDGNAFKGKIVWLKVPKDPETGKDKVDGNNPQANLRNRQIIGLEVLKGFSFENGEYINGTIYDPKAGKIYDCKMWFGESTDELKIRGYWGWLFRTESWTRSSLND